MKTGTTLIVMGSGNVSVLYQTLKSVEGICDEIVYGDLLLWEEDRIQINEYAKEFNMTIIPFPWNHLYEYGFSSLLNILASHATNPYILYLNTSEIIEKDFGVVEAIKNNPDCNAFYFTHLSDMHRWFRLYKKDEMQWSGIIHEQLKGEYIPYHKSVFQMADLPKDMMSIEKAKILDSLKEIVYFRQYMNLIDKPEALGETDHGWVRFSKENYDSFKERLGQRKDQVAAVEAGDLDAFLNAAKYDIENQTFKSSIAVEYQNDNRFLGKK
jgi:hypothetical protein